MAAPAAKGDAFVEEKFMRDLVNLKDTQESINGLSTWCLKNRKNAYKISKCWLKVIKKVKAEQKIPLFYLLNDIVQHAKRKQAVELVSRCEGVLREAMPTLKEDERVCSKVLRVIGIWQERQIFSDDFIEELKAIVDPSVEAKHDHEILDSFQPTQLRTQLKIMKALEDDSDYKLKTLRENDVNESDLDALRHTLKDRQHGNDFIGDLEEGRQRMEQYIKALEREVNKRRQVIETLVQADKYYSMLLGEADIVTKAYSNFGKRVEAVHEKLETRLPDLESRVSISPMPSPDYNAPSPGDGDEMELELPEDDVAQPTIVVNQPALSHAEMSTYTPSVAEADLNSRIDSMIGVFPGSSNSSSLQPSQPGGGSGLSVSEFLTKLAHGEAVDVEKFTSGAVKQPPSISSQTATATASASASASWWPASQEHGASDGAQRPSQWQHPPPMSMSLPPHHKPALHHRPPPSLAPPSASQYQAPPPSSAWYSEDGPSGNGFRKAHEAGSSDPHSDRKRRTSAGDHDDRAPRRSSLQDRLRNLAGGPPPEVKSSRYEDAPPALPPQDGRGYHHGGDHQPRDGGYGGQGGHWPAGRGRGGGGHQGYDTRDGYRGRRW